MDYNLDEGIKEFFTFILCGNTYHFRYPNTEEIEDWAKIGKEENKEKLMDFMQKYITPVGECKPFKEIQGKMLSPQLIKFRDMLFAELGIAEAKNASNKN